MKRLFQRQATNTNANVDVASERGSLTGDSPDKRRAYSPERVAAVFRKSTSPENREKQKEISSRPPVSSINDDELHDRVVAYMTAAAEDAQTAALQAIHRALKEDGDARQRLSDKDAGRLVGVCSQRVRVAFQRKLEARNASILEGAAQAPALVLAEADQDVVGLRLALAVLLRLLVKDRDDAKHAILVVSERLPSTLVKVLKAGPHHLAKQDGVTDLILQVLAKLVTFRDTVQELLDSLTVHRLFYLSFDSPDRQRTVVEIIESLFRSVPDAMWDGILVHLYENRCLIGLLSAAIDAACFEKVLSITAKVLSTAYKRNNLALHRQLRVEQFYPQAFSIFKRVLEEGFDDFEHQDRQDAIRVKLGELCLSGSESAVGVADFANDNCFALMATRHIPKSCFNVEAFALICQIVEHLQRDPSCENDTDRTPSPNRTAQCHHIQSQYIQKIGRFIVENPYDYIFIRRSGIIDFLIRELHLLAELSKHAVGSVLAAATIEAKVVPFSELSAMASYLTHASSSSTSKCGENDIMVILVFISNILRFEAAFREILRDCGVIDAVISLFQAQCTVVISEDISSTRINVAYPTSTLKVGRQVWEKGSSTDVKDRLSYLNEKNLVVLLTSHCRQTCSVRKSETRTPFSARLFTLSAELLIAYAESWTMDGDEVDDDDSLPLRLCDISFLECLCVLLADDKYQEQALQLWFAILRITLRIRKQNSSLYNTVNCFLQAVRYVTLSLYYKHETGITFAFQGSTTVLKRSLDHLGSLFRIDSTDGTCTSLTWTTIMKPDLERLLVAFVDSHGIFTCLAIIWSLIRSGNGLQPIDENYDEIFLLAIRLMHAFILMSRSAAEVFEQFVTFGLYGDMLHQYIEGRYSCASEGHPNQSLRDLCVRSLNALLELATGDPLSNASIAGHRQELKQPFALLVTFQLLRLWTSKIGENSVRDILAYTDALLLLPENVRAGAEAGLCEVIFRSCATHPSLSNSRDENETLECALLDVDNLYHSSVLSIFKRAASVGCTHSQLRQWISIIATTAPAKVQLGYKRIKIEPLMNILNDTLVASRSTSPFRNDKGIVFDVSGEGFAQMQVPEVIARPQGFHTMYQQTAQSPAAGASTQPPFGTLGGKVWPPADGYTVMTWIRIDALETKDVREKYYWDCLMSNQCVMCKNVMKDEVALKCSHRACRACHEALFNNGGECVVCNPPMFYLYRFRSGDGKSVSEVFLRGSRLHMRTTGNTKAGVHQFAHPPLQLGCWTHVVIAHSRQRFQSSQASLYINGANRDTVKISYPSSVSSGQPLSGLFGIPSQARRVSTSRWTMGPVYLVDEPLSAHLVNCVFAAGPSYGGLFDGPNSANELYVCLDHLSTSTLLLIDEYTRDPIRTLLESVEAAERNSRSTILRGSLTLASAASSTAAAIVQEIKSKSSSSASIFTRIPSAAVSVSVPITQDKILLAYSSTNAVGVDLTVVPSGKMDGRPLAQLLGGAMICGKPSIPHTLQEMCGSAARFAYILIHQAKTAREVELSLNILAELLRGMPSSLSAMENEHGYGIVNYFLHQKSGICLTAKVLSSLFQIVGVDVEQDVGASEGRRANRESAIRNLFAMQYFILDYSLWQKSPVATQRLLFSTLYECLMASGDQDEGQLRERNRSQLQSLSLVRQLLYVFLDPEAEADLLRVIADLILVCLTSKSSNSSRSDSMILEANFAEMASFLVSTLSSRFARVRGDEDSKGSPDKILRRVTRMESPLATKHAWTGSMPDHYPVKEDNTVGRLCLSPRGRGNARILSQYSSAATTELPGTNILVAETQSDTEARDVVSSAWRTRQAETQELLLDVLTKAVQKYDLKENRERDELDGYYLEGSNTGSGDTTIHIAGSGITGTGSAAQRLQLGALSGKLAGFRKVLSPRWIGYFLFPSPHSRYSSLMSPKTVIAALRLLAALLTRPRYENVFRKEGYYRLLGQGLPSSHRAFEWTGFSFPFDQMWYTLFCILLGPPVDGMPPVLQFDMFFLTKDFELNIQRDRLANGSISYVMLALIRRYYSDNIVFASLRLQRISPEKSVMEQVLHALPASNPDINLFHNQVLDFLYHAYATMPSFRRLLILSQGATNSNGTQSGPKSAIGNQDGKLRGEVLEELALVACGAARGEILSKYMPNEKHVHRIMLKAKRELTAYEFATCAIEIADEAASEDNSGEDPFQHPVALRAIKLLVAVLCEFLVIHPKGGDHVEAFFDGQHGSALAPRLPDGLHLRFLSLTMMSLLEQTRLRFSDSDLVSHNKAFNPNIKQFMSLAINKMNVWQRAQYGDGCPKFFRCCGEKSHFSGGPFVLLDVALFVLEDSATGTSTGSNHASSSSGLGQLIHDRLTSSSSTSAKSGKPSKRRHTIRNMILSKVHFGSNKSTELEGLTSSMYRAANAVVLHMLHGHGSDVSDDECETLLQLVHLHREVLLSTRNTQENKEFFVCLCRVLLQLISPNGSGHTNSISSRELQEVAGLVWIDLMTLQKPFMIDLLTVEIRRSGGSPYMINLMKNGFDVLLECCRTDSEGSTFLTASTAFKRFQGWLEVVGPPLAELETRLNRTFVKVMVESKEVVRDGWAEYHKRLVQRRNKESKRFATKFDWFAMMEREYFETLVEAQQTEFRRQLKWRQDRIDRQKFYARQWEQLRNDLMEHQLRSEEGASQGLSRVILPTIVQRGTGVKNGVSSAQSISWQLDATEGPARMRKRLLVRNHTSHSYENEGYQTDRETLLNWKPVRLGASSSQSPKTAYRVRRYSESDVDLVKSLPDRIDTSLKRSHPSRSRTDSHPYLTSPIGVQSSPTKRRDLHRRVSFEDLLRHDSDDEDTSKAELPRNSCDSHRKDSNLSAKDALGSDNEEDDHEASTTSLFGNLSDVPVDADTDAVDEKLRPLLVPGDEILDIYDCLRVDGMDACPGVLIICSDNVYIVDNYQLVLQYGPSLPNRSGEGDEATVAAKVTEVSKEAPTRLERRLSLRFQLPTPRNRPLTPSGLTMQRSSFSHQCRSWAYDDIIELHKRRHQLRHVALELFAHDGRNYLITFESPEQRENVFHSLIAKCPNVRGAAYGMDRSLASGDLYSQLKKLLRQNMTERWIAREITNFDYLMHLNTLAGRSYNDLTQYPVFPWVLANYTSATIDLSDPGVYRDLTKPMGALYREVEFRTRYESLADGSEDTENPMGVKPFHYGTHYSSAGIVLHFLMRMEPFTAHFLRLQGGKFDHADRLFSSVAGAWKSAAGVDSAHNGTQDVKELIPEFFYLPSFLKNMNHRQFGKDQNGIIVDDVKLPPWANGSAREFVRINREALESHFVSANLHHWIDLIFGYKQQGKEAVDACNVFYHLTYEGAVDLDAIADVNMRRAMVDQISEFGQTPSRLFKTPHPPRVRGTNAPSSTGSLGPLNAPSALTNSEPTVGSPPPPSSGSLSLTTAAGRAALASSFIEGSEIVSRMHSILTSSSSLGNSSFADDSAALIDHAAMLQQDPRREVALNPIVASYRGHYQVLSTIASGFGVPSSPPVATMRTRQLSSGMVAAPIHQIAISSASVTRDERVATVGDNCLLIPPRNHEFFAWGFQDRTLKVMSTASSEITSGGDSKVLSSFEIEFAINVACMTSDGRILIAGGASAPVVRLWHFGSSKKTSGLGGSSGSTSSGGRKRAYSVGLHTGSTRLLSALATLCVPSHMAPITAVQACRAYSIIVSGCASGNAVLWDLNRLRYVRTLKSLQTDSSSPNRDPVSAVAINEITGDIVVAYGAVFGVYDVNGEPLARLSCDSLLHDSQYPRAVVTSMAVSTSAASEWCKEKAVITGHADGVLCIWSYSHTGYGDSDVSIELKGRHWVTRTLSGSCSPSRSAISALMLSEDERKLYTGNVDGLLSLWTTPQLSNAPTTPTKSLVPSLSPMPAL